MDTIERDCPFCKVRVDPKNDWIYHVCDDKINSFYQDNYSYLTVSSVLYKVIINGNYKPNEIRIHYDISGKRIYVFDKKISLNEEEFIKLYNKYVSNIDTYLTFL